MAFCFNPKRSLAHEFQRVTVEELDAAQEGLNAKNIHLARSRLKRVRAVLKLIDLKDDATAAEQERALRDAGRCLSEVRDIEASVKTLEMMEHKQPKSKKPLPPKLFEHARVCVKAVKDPAEHKRAIPEASQRIAAARQILLGWLPNTGWKSVRAALAHSYGRAQRTLKKACGAGDDDQKTYDANAMHRLRKRLKTLWIQLRLFCECWPQGAKEPAHAAERLSDLLGHEHDLVILRQRLVRAGADASLAPLFEKIAARRAELDQKCLDLAEKFLAEKPGAFAARIFGE